MSDPLQRRPDTSSTAREAVNLSTTDDLLASVFSDMAERMARGEQVDIEALANAYPDHAMEIRELWGAALLADAVGQEVVRFERSYSDSSSSLPAVVVELPARFGNYELLEELGRGGMGIVYRARQLNPPREVAVKMLLRGEMATEADESRFREEAEAAAQLQHPGVVPVYEVGECEGRKFFSMGFIRGNTMAQWLLDLPIDFRVGARLLRDVAIAIDYAHAQGVLHRDLKPSNILIDHAGRAHVTDFGLARRVADPHSLTRTGAILGTPAYMSPEQAVGKRGELGPASDVYSLGAILYQMLTGRPPFQASSPVNIVLQLLEQEVIPPRMVNPDANRDLSMIALRCLQKPPDLRYDSAAALARDLDAYLRDEPVSARSGRFSQIVARWLRETHHAVILQNWGLLWMWHSLVLLVVCGLTAGLKLLDDTNRWHYFLLWTAGLGAWASVFWWLRRRLGPVTFVERQIAHVWAASMISIALLFPVEWILRLPVLTLSPVLALASGTVFLIKAGMLSGGFYLPAMALYVTALAMACWPRWAHLIFGVVAAASFYFPGLKYYRARQKNGLDGNR